MEVPQLNERTGVSYDFFNEFIALGLIFRVYGIGGVNYKINAFPLRRYEEYFYQFAGNGLVNDRNRARVARLNRLVDSMNNRASLEGLSEREFKSSMNIIHFLIYDDGISKVFC